MTRSALLLDIDGTIIDTPTAMRMGASVAARRLWPEADEDTVAAAAEHYRSDPGGYFRRFSSGELSLAQMRHARLAELTGALDLAPTRWERFEAEYEPAFQANLAAFPDVRPLVETIRERGYAVGLLTNSGAEYSARKLTHTGQADLFDVLVTRDTLGYGKPDARVFHHACDLLGAAPEQTWYVGDEIDTDALGAADAGLSSLWLCRRPAHPDQVAQAQGRGVRVVDGLAEVDRLLAGEGRGGRETIAGEGRGGRETIAGAAFPAGAPVRGAVVHRTTARVLPVDRSGRVLLLHGWDPDHPGRPFWFTIGGQVEAGEDLQLAAVREMAEEVDIRVAPEDLGEPMHEQTIEFDWDGRHLVQQQTFFACAVDETRISFAGRDALERDSIDRSGWWSAAELLADGTAADPCLPALLERGAASVAARRAVATR